MFAESKDIKRNITNKFEEYKNILNKLRSSKCKIRQAPGFNPNYQYVLQIQMNTVFLVKGQKDLVQIMVAHIQLINQLVLSYIPLIKLL